MMILSQLTASRPISHNLPPPIICKWFEIWKKNSRETYANVWSVFQTLLKLHGTHWRGSHLTHNRAAVRSAISSTACVRRFISVAFVWGGSLVSYFSLFKHSFFPCVSLSTPSINTASQSNCKKSKNRCGRWYCPDCSALFTWGVSGNRQSSAR